jgi:hypothetical protein
VSRSEPKTERLKFALSAGTRRACQRPAQIVRRQLLSLQGCKNFYDSAAAIVDAT